MSGIEGCTAALRDECELRYVLSLSTKAERADYLDRAERFDGKASTDRLRQRVTAAWHAARDGTPHPCGCVGSPDAQASVHPTSELPGDGSFLTLPDEGNSGPVGSVVSGGAA